MYGSHRKCGGKWERRHGRFSSVLTCTRCHAKRRLGIQVSNVSSETHQIFSRPAMLFRR